MEVEGYIDELGQKLEIGEYGKDWDQERRGWDGEWIEYDNGGIEWKGLLGDGTGNGQSN